MFSKLCDRFRTRRVDDPVFGDLYFVRMRAPSRSYWEGRGLFPATGSSVAYSIEAGEEGPGEAQRELYRRIAANYTELTRVIAPVLRREYEACMAAPASADIAGFFRLDALSVPPCESPTMEWDMDFSCMEDNDFLFTVSFRGWQPTGEISVMH
jgi:hypothetical protein